jgi:hypothetical protein
MQSPPRLRPLTNAQVLRLQVLRHAATLLDSALVVPGTSYRIGLDPILGLIPGLGDLVSPVFAIALLWQARDLGIPRVVQLRMVFNVAIDAILGAIPVAGDLFDFAWKANDMNIALLERHATEIRRSSAADWLFVTAMVLLLVGIAALPFVTLALLIGFIRSYVA